MDGLKLTVALAAADTVVRTQAAGVPMGVPMGLPMGVPMGVPMTPTAAVVEGINANNISPSLGAQKSTLFVVALLISAANPILLAIWLSEASAEDVNTANGLLLGDEKLAITSRSLGKRRMVEEVSCGGRKGGREGGSEEGGGTMVAGGERRPVRIFFDDGETEAMVEPWSGLVGNGCA